MPKSRVGWLARPALIPIVAMAASLAIVGAVLMGAPGPAPVADVPAVDQYTSNAGGNGLGAPAPDPPGSGFMVGHSPIKHIIILVRENHSFDNLFGTFPGANGTRYAHVGPTVVKMTKTPDMLSRDIVHAGGAAYYAVDGGYMDQFYNEQYAWQNGQDVADSQYQKPQIPIYWSYASHYALADDFFATVQSSSFSNHLVTITGSSLHALDNPAFSKGSWGCDAPRITFVVVYDQGHSRDERPCFNHQTIADEANAAGVSWRYYAAPFGSARLHLV